MKVGIDIDNVLAATHECLLKRLNMQPFSLNLSLEEWKTYYFWDAFNISKERTQEMFHQIISEGFLMDIPAMPVGRYVLDRYGFEKYFITARPANQTGPTMEWLSKNQIKYSAKNLHFVGSGSRLEREIPSEVHRKAYLARKFGLHCFIEDCGEIAMEVARLGIPVILFNFPWNEHVSHPNIFRVGYWKDKCSYWKETENTLNMFAAKLK
ncbi:MAG: hypothetical protein V1906_00640 [Candidatus Woesearchaeota archaeon]